MNSQRLSYIIKQHNINTIERIIGLWSRPNHKPIRGSQTLIKYYQHNEFGAFINVAAENGHVNVLEWGASQTPKILLTQRGMNEAATYGHVNVLVWGASQTPPILPTQEGMNMAVYYGHVNIIEWGASQNPPILPKL